MSANLPGKHQPVWADAVVPRDYGRLTGDLDVDVAVVGAGIAGLTTALLLKRMNKSVAVIEAGRIGQQVTGRSNAKITSLHGLIYADLIRRIGEDKARLYAEANQAAIERVEEFVAEFDMDCGFKRAPAYTFVRDAANTAAIEAEVDAAQRLDLPATLVHDTELPYPVAAAVRFGNQAQFNPVAYLQGLSSRFHDDGGVVFEHTRACEIEHGDPCRVATETGTVTARDVIVATNLPTIREGEFHSKTTPRAHLVVAAPLDEDQMFSGMYLCVDRPTHSVRTAYERDGPVLVVVGESFAPGHVHDTASMYRELESFVTSQFAVPYISHRWSNEDYDSRDRIPFIGPADEKSPHLLVATGFCSWGMTGGTAAGLILANKVQGRSILWAPVFDSLRVPGTAENEGSPEMRVDGTEPAYPRSAEELREGEGGIFADGGDERIAAYRDDAGHIHRFSAVCTHLGCELGWNNAERTWNCHCHGSIFAADGGVLHGPAVKSLDRR